MFALMLMYINEWQLTYKLYCKSALYCTNSHIYFHNKTNMIGSKRKDKIVPRPEETKLDPQSDVRRSARVIKPKSIDDFFVGYDQLDLYFGKDSFEEDHGAKRPRRSYYYDDLSDFSDNHRSHKKKHRGSDQMRRLQPLNAVEGLLKWREQVNNIPIPDPTKDNSQLVKVKNICKEQLDKHAQGIEALFINIQWNKKNQKIEDVKNLKIQSLKLMSKGLIFIWTAKDHISEIIQLMEQKGFNYVENLEIGILDRQKAYDIYKRKRRIPQKLLQKVVSQDTTVVTKEYKKKQSKKSQKQISTQLQIEQYPLQAVIQSLQNIHPADIIHTAQSQFFNTSKRTLYIFRRATDEKLELRHQRTCDAVFDMPKNPNGKCQLQLKNYIFLMIQTMLPKCLEYTNGKYKMMQLWGDNQMRRRGWVTLVQD